MMRVGIDLVPLERFRQFVAWYESGHILQRLGPWVSEVNLPLYTQVAIVWAFKEAYAKALGVGIRQLPPLPLDIIIRANGHYIESPSAERLLRAIWIPYPNSLACVVWCEDPRSPKRPLETSLGERPDSSNNHHRYPPLLGWNPVEFTPLILCASEIAIRSQYALAYVSLPARSRCQTPRIPLGRSRIGHEEGRALLCGVLRQLVTPPLSSSEIAVCRGPGGEPQLKVRAQAQQQLQQVGIDDLSISVSHTPVDVVVIVNWVHPSHAKVHACAPK